MSKLKIEKGASKVRRAPLKATIDGAVADDLELMCEWWENDSSYLVNLLLGFAMSQSEEFQKYKTNRIVLRSQPTSSAKSEPSPATQTSESSHKGDPIPAARV